MFDLEKPTADGLPTPEVGGWSRDKHHFLRRYIDAFTTAMRPKRWSALNYIDLFAGPGLLQIKGKDEYEWGSPMIAAMCNRFQEIHVCEMNADHLETLRQRMSLLKPSARVFYYGSDANATVHELTKCLRPRSLSLAFLDSFGLDLPYATLQALANHRVDLIIFLPDFLDIVRNWEHVYQKQTNSKLDHFLGTGVDGRHQFNASPKDKLADVAHDLYVDQIRKLGYEYFHAERIAMGGTRLYRLVFCSRNSAGDRIWRGIAKKKPDGQMTWDYD